MNQDQQDGTAADDMPSSMRGSAPADLHAYRRGRRLSSDGRSRRPMSLHQGADTVREAAASVRESVRNIDEQRLARALGWFSVALGLAEVMAPRHLGRAIGVQGNENLLRAMGLREIASGVGILTRPQSGWMWSRVAGDAMDLAFLGAAMTSPGSNRARLAAATAAVAGVTALDVLCSQQLSRNPDPASESGEPPVVHETIAVNDTPETCYRAWRDLTSIPGFMRHVRSVRDMGEGRHHWIVEGPAGDTLEFDSRITADEPNRMIAWETTPGADVEHHGSVRFEPAPGGRGTFLHVEMSVAAPGGVIGTAAAKVSGHAPGQQVSDGLRRFKQMLEAGEIARTEGQPAGERSTVYNFVRKATGR